ncbi:MAG: FliH/SctL family protein [Sandaracinaceae bacterium]
MSERAARSLFRSVESVPRGGEWMSNTPPTVRPLDLGATPKRPSPAPRPTTTAGPSPIPKGALQRLEAEIRADVDRELDAAKAQLAAEQQRLVAERNKLEAERVTLVEQQRRFSSALGEMADHRARVREELVGPVLELATALAEALVERELTTSNDLATRLARAALESLGEADGAQLRVSQATYDAVVEVHGEAAIQHEGRSIPVVVDASVDGLGAIAVAGWTRVDGRVRERLAAAREAMEHERRLEVEPKP